MKKVADQEPKTKREEARQTGRECDLLFGVAWSAVKRGLLFGEESHVIGNLNSHIP